MLSRWILLPSSLGRDLSLDCAGPDREEFPSPKLQLRLMGYLHKKSRDKKGDSLIHDVFQGEVQAHPCPAVGNQI